MEATPEAWKSFIEQFLTLQRHFSLNTTKITLSLSILNIVYCRSGRGQNTADGYTQIVQEGVPVPLQGHSHEIETVLTDGHLVASHCLGGRICVWDSLTGENLLVCTVYKAVLGIRTGP